MFGVHLYPSSRCATLAGLLLLLTICLAEDATAAKWAACGDEAGTQKCENPTRDDVIVRYGHGHNYFFVGVYGKSSIPCTNWNGDPSYGDGKQCSYTPNPYAEAVEWSPCSKLGETCEIPDQPTWIRYGTDDNWVQLIHSGPFQCTAIEVGYPIVEGFSVGPGRSTRCETGGPVYTDENFPEGKPKWVPCATEDQQCQIPGGQQEPVLLRYGIGDSWTYRFAMIDSIRCDNVVIGFDPAVGRRKVCEYSFMPVYAETVGDWDMPHDCTGSSCAISYSVTVGTSRSQTEITEKEWSETVTISMERGFDIKGVSASVSNEHASSYAHSESFQESLTLDSAKTSTVECGKVGEGQSLRIYQFITATEQACLLSGSCTGTTHTTSFLCVVDPPEDYKGPQCLPTYCKDELCTECTY